MGSAQLAFTESNACAGQVEPGSRHAISEQCPLGRVDASPTNSSQNLGDLRQGRGRPLHLRRQLSLPNLFFEGQGCVGLRLAQPPPLYFSPDRPDPTGNQANQGTEAQDSVSGPALEEPTLVRRAVSHAPIAGQSVGKNNLVVRFLKESRRLNPPCPITVPTWDLPTVLRALKSPLLEPLQSVDFRPLMLKTVYGRSSGALCLEFGPGDSKVILKPRHGYIPKVLSTPFRAQVITLSALPPSEQDQELNLLCPVRALRFYIERSAPFRQMEQLFVCFGGHTKGSPVTKQRLSKWIIDTIALAYSSLGLQRPMGVRAHSTRGVASSWAWSSSVSIAEIFAAAGWALPSTFTLFYNLDVPAIQARVLSA